MNKFVIASIRWFSRHIIDQSQYLSGIGISSSRHAKDNITTIMPRFLSVGVGHPWQGDRCAEEVRLADVVRGLHLDVSALPGGPGLLRNLCLHGRRKRARRQKSLRHFVVPGKSCCTDDPDVLADVQGFFSRLDCLFTNCPYIKLRLAADSLLSGTRSVVDHSWDHI